MNVNQNNNTMKKPNKGEEKNCDAKTFKKHP